MLITINTYYILTTFFAAIVLAVPLFLKYVRKTGRRFDFVFVFAFLLIPINWFTPAVYTVSDCGKYTEEVLIFPTVLDGQELDLGQHNYIINKSSSTLILEDAVYGSIDKADVLPTVAISPSTNYKAPFIHLDYAFETLPQTERTKANGTIKHTLSCR